MFERVDITQPSKHVIACSPLSFKISASLWLAQERSPFLPCSRLLLHIFPILFSPAWYHRLSSHFLRSAFVFKTILGVRFPLFDNLYPNYKFRILCFLFLYFLQISFFSSCLPVMYTFDHASIPASHVNMDLYQCLTQFFHNESLTNC
jgi:hypothetical protein